MNARRNIFDPSRPRCLTTAAGSKRGPGATQQHRGRIVSALVWPALVLYCLDFWAIVIKAIWKGLAMSDVLLGVSIIVLGALIFAYLAAAQVDLAKYDDQWLDQLVRKHEQKEK
jgi:hypothetical protein